MQSEPPISWFGLWEGISLNFSANCDLSLFSFFLAQFSQPATPLHFSDSVYVHPLPHKIMNPSGMRMDYAVLCHPCHLVVGQPPITAPNVTLASLSNLLSIRQANDFLQTNLVVTPSLTDACIFGEVSLGFVHIQMARETQESLILSLSGHFCPCLLFVSALVTLSFENLGHIEWACLLSPPSLPSWGFFLLISVFL